MLIVVVIVFGDRVVNIFCFLREVKIVVGGGMKSLVLGLGFGDYGFFMEG